MQDDKVLYTQVLPSVKLFDFLLSILLINCCEVLVNRSAAKKSSKKGMLLLVFQGGHGALDKQGWGFAPFYLTSS